MQNKNINSENILKVGFDHYNCNPEVIGKVSFTSGKIKAAYLILKNIDCIKESVILSTCNRSEIYAYCTDLAEAKKVLTEFYESFFGLNSEILDLITILTGIDAINHIFELPVGYKSMVKCENQILGQVKNAYHEAVNNNASAKVLNKLFLQSITAAKKIKTLLPVKNLSVASVGIKILEKQFETLDDKNILIIGLGQLSRLVLNNLLKKNIKKVYLTTKTAENLIDFQINDDRINKIEFKDRYKIINDIDCIISCTAAPHYVLHKEKFVEYYKNKPLIMLDLAVPADIEPCLANFENIKVFNLDDVKNNIEKNQNITDNAVIKGTQLLEKDIEKYLLWIEKTNAGNFYSEKILPRYA